MKIHSLHIKNYKQFSDLALDLTYPKGHPKEGDPLDKICIIGQSGTGKTNLLEIIRDKLNNDKVKTSFFIEKSSEDEKVYFAGIKTNIKNYQDIKMSFDDETSIEKLIKALDELHLTEKKIQTELFLESLKRPKYNIGLANKSFSLGESKYTTKEKEELINSKITEIKEKYQRHDFSNENYINIDESAWRLLEEKIANYDYERLKYTDRLSNKLLNIDDYTKDDFKVDIAEWEEKNENISDKISDKLNTILRKFNLELTKIDENQKSYNDLSIKDLSNGNIIEYDNLSTGTKNIIATFIPLKIHNPKDSIILIDEPENSFYPDIQRKLTELYSEVGENNQLIMATHSPLIASSFEPWEVVELKFDKNNQIYRELYYKDENHIDNYTLDPRLLTWTGILTDIFDLKEDSNFTFRERKLMEYASLKAEIKAIENIDEKEKKFKQLMKLSKLLGLVN